MMKHLLHCMLTPEDFDIWLRVTHAPDTRLALRHLYTRSVVTGDRRDAALMLRLTRGLRGLSNEGRPVMVHWLMSIDLSGWLD